MNILQIILLILTLVALGFVTVWAAKRYRRLKYSRIKTRVRYQTRGEEGAEEDFRSELPSGGARVVAVRDPDDIDTVNSRIREQAEANKPKLSISLRSPSEQEALDLGLDDNQNDPHIPVLLDPADEITSAPSIEEESLDNLEEEVGAPLAEPEPELIAETESGLDSAIESEPEPESVAEVQETETEIQPDLDKPDHSILFSDPETTEKHPYTGQRAEAKIEKPTEQAAEPDHTEQVEPEVRVEAATAPESEPELEASEAAESEQEQTADADRVEPSEPPPLDEVIIINLMATAEGEEFRGTDLCTALETQGMKHGKMDIFHFDSGSGADTIRFSVANVLNPGTFPTEKLEYFYTPGICFFMTLTPGVSNLQAFNKLLSAARGVASKLGGELQDQERNYLTHQRIETIRTQMGEFQRKNLQG
jgi:cell division protein ZipA